MATKKKKTIERYEIYEGEYGTEDAHWIEDHETEEQAIDAVNRFLQEDFGVFTVVKVTPVKRITQGEPIIENL